MATNLTTGKFGEDLAATYFTNLGYTILHQNWRHKHWEVDIIATKNNVLHFVEVKTRKSKKFGLPEENVTKQKIKYLINAAEEYLYLNPQWQRIQFDVLAISILQNKEIEYFLIEDVYL